MSIPPLHTDFAFGNYADTLCCTLKGLGKIDLGFPFLIAITPIRGKANRDLNRIATTIFRGFSTVALLLFVIPPAFAGHYELVRGNGVEVCEAYQGNLNAGDPREPLICAREIHPQFREFSAPVWTSLDLWENRFLYWSIKNALENLPQDRPLTKDDERWIKRRSQPGWAPQMYTTAIDIDNDGHVENVVMYKGGICGIAEKVYATTLLVQRDAASTVDIRKTKLLLQNTYRDQKTGEVKEAPFSHLFNMYGIFRFRNVTYFDRADARQGERDALYVYSALKGRAVRVCEYRFVER